MASTAAAFIPFCLSAISIPCLASESNADGNSNAQRAAAPLDMLGNAAVRIPPHFRRYVEFSGKAAGAGIQREARVVKSFGFDVRFPDMQGLPSPALHRDFRSRAPDRSTWLFVGINAAENYPGPQALTRLAKASLAPDQIPWHTYEKVDEVFGLERYSRTAIDPSTGKPFSESKHTFDIYVHRRGDLSVDTYIRCSNSQFESAPCIQYFDHPMQVEVFVHYRRGMLKDWRAIQEKAGDLLSSFRVGIASGR